MLDRVSAPARQDHGCLRRTHVRKVTGVAVGVGGAPDGLGEDLGQGHIPARNGQFGQRAAESGGEPGDGVHTPVVALRRRHAVQQDERLRPGRRRAGRRCPVLVGAVGVAGLRGEFDTHPASLHDAFTDPRTSAARWASYQQVSSACLSGRNGSGRRAGGHPAKAWRGSSSRRPGRATATRRGDLFANSGVMFTPSGGGAVDARPLSKALGWSEAVPGGRGAVPVDRASPLLMGGRVRIASTGAEEAASAQGQQRTPFRGDTAAPGRREPTGAPYAYATGSSSASPSSATVIAAGAPAVLAASSELNDSQQLVTLAELNQQALTLAHSLADERDEVTAYIAAGRDAKAEERRTQQPQRPRRPAGRRDPRHGRLRRAAPRPRHHPRAAPHRAHRQGHGARGPPGVLRGHRRSCTASPSELAEQTPPRAAGPPVRPRRARPAVRAGLRHPRAAARRADRART